MVHNYARRRSLAKHLPLYLGPTIRSAPPGSVLDRRGVGQVRSARMPATDQQFQFTSHSTCRSREGCDHNSSSTRVLRPSDHRSAGHRMPGDQCRGLSGRRLQVTLFSLNLTFPAEQQIAAPRPGPGFPGSRRKQTLAGRAIVPKVNFLHPVVLTLEGSDSQSRWLAVCLESAGWRHSRQTVPATAAALLRFNQLQGGARQSTRGRNRAASEPLVSTPRQTRPLNTGGTAP